MESIELNRMKLKKLAFYFNRTEAERGFNPESN